MKMMEKLGHYFIYILFIIVCGFLIYYGYTQADKLKKFNKNVKEVVGTIQYVSSDYKKVNISYAVDGNSYQLRLPENKDQTLKEGTSIKIYYDKNNPKDAQRKLTNANTGYFVMLFGFVFEIFLVLRLFQELR